MPIDKRLLDILCCPLSRQALQMLPRERLDALNSSIAAGGVKQHDGATLSQPVSEALVTADGKRAYRIDDGIPVLLIEEAIELDLLGV